MTTALVISGGGSKGAFAVGAVQYMREELGLTFDMVAGTSTGALIGPLVVTDEIPLLKQIYTSVKTADILKSPQIMQDVMTRGYYFKTDPLEALVKKTFDAARTQKILMSPVPVFLTTTCLQTGRTTYFQTGQFDGRAEQSADLVRVLDRPTLISSVIASANQPILMPPIAIGPANPLREYVDGGVREYAPINVAVTNGATEVYVVVHSPPPGTSGPDEGRMVGMLKVATKTIHLLTDEVGENDLRLTEIYSEATQYLEQIRANARTLGLTNSQITQLFSGANPLVGRRSVNLHIIRPEKDFPTEGLEFDPAIMKELVTWGARRAKEVLG